MSRKSDRGERPAEEIIRASNLCCRWCGKAVDKHRVYFGVVGPFCNVICRSAYTGML